MTNSEIKSIAKEKINGKRGVLIIAALITTVISAVSAIPYFGVVINLIIAGPLTLGFAGMVLMIVEGKTPKIEDLFDGFKNFVNAFVTYLLLNIYLALWSLLIVPIFIKPFSYAMTFYILRDHPEMSASDAITKSREMMDGNKWKLFCLHFSFIGWYLLGILTLGILYIWLIPYVRAAEAQFYLDLKGETTEDSVVKEDLVCPLCGEKNEYDSKYCSRCGEVLKKDESIICPLCGEKNDLESKYCSKCGHNLEQ